MLTLLLLNGGLGSVGGAELVETIPESRVIDCAEEMGLLKVSVVILYEGLVASAASQAVRFV
ncbi:hypothetical protein N44_02049 [Microcystis aeruginosa NIES-44]|uniref:Uncharacterized protein n=1 Tax=Microcystis aeruginosa NIES-44 TaxID=449439 RepID=A0A0A1VU73_MICAE|nr:hypothetical protein N44_02049 [Microcystis aeruginosa NIES-44]